MRSARSAARWRRWTLRDQDAVACHPGLFFFLGEDFLSCILTAQLRKYASVHIQRDIVT
jgi:hypothetical protein